MLKLLAIGINKNQKNYVYIGNQLNFPGNFSKNRNEANTDRPEDVKFAATACKLKPGPKFTIDGAVWQDIIKFEYVLTN